MATEVLPASLSGYSASPNEKEAYNFLFKKADTESLGVLTGDTAVPFFNHSGLPVPILGDIWQFSDPDNSGFLTPERFGVACRLIGHAQSEGAASQVNQAWITSQGPLPRFEGFPIPEHLHPPQGIAQPPPVSRSPLQPQGTGSSNAPVGTPGVSVTAEEKAKYAKIFASSNPVNGLLDGDNARNIFIKSKLPFDTLGKIWNLADTHSRGSLDVADFTIGMHLIQHTMNGTLPTLPAVLNPALYASALALPVQPGSPAPSSRIAQVPTSPLRQSSVAPSPIVSQGTGTVLSYQAPQQSYSAFRPQVPATPVVVPWDVTAAEKAESDQYFDSVDTARRGAVDGESAVGFFVQSGLPVEQLAKVWDLADIRETGTLNKDEFAVALKIIRDNLAGKEIPSVLPLSLTPPSLRKAVGAAAPPAQPQRDLLDWDDDEPTTTTTLSPQATGQLPALSPQATGPIPQSTIFPQGTGNRAISTQSTGTSYTGLQGTIFPQATGASAQTLSPQATGQARAVPVPAPATNSNFFDDNDDADQNQKLSADSAQLGNLQNEHASVTSAVAKLGQTRSELEASLSATTTAINELQVKLSQARAAHETERQMVEDLQSRHKDQASLLARQRTELITAESDLSALRVERTEIEGNYLRDKEDVRDMKKKMAEIATETAALKEELEKKKKEARQQKGLVAISKKQLATVEGEKEKVVAEMKEVEQGGSRAIEHEEDSPFDHTVAPIAAGIPLPVSSGVTPIVSPASSVRSTNPFDRLGAISSVTSPLASQGPTQAPTPIHSAPSPGPSAPPTSVPIAAAAAVGAGAVAAVTAVGAGIAGVFGGKGEEHEEKNKSLTAPEVGSEPPSKEVTPEVDPFGVPISVSPSAPGTAPSTSAFDSAFDDGFGDNFSATPTPMAHSAVEPAAPSSTAFDDAFADMDAPVPAAATEPTMKEEAAAAAEPNPEEGTLEQNDVAIAPTPAPVSDAEPEVPPAPVEKDVTPFPTSIQESTPFDTPAQEIERDEPDSSDDEHEVEDAGPSIAHGSRDLSDSVSPHVGTSTSDSGESFVHVTAPVEAEAEAKFPALETLPEPAAISPVAVEASPVSGNRSTSPSSELDTFVDAAAESTSPSSTTFGDIPAPTKKRPAPPPPAARTSIPSIAAATIGGTESTPFDDAFDSSFDSAAAPIPSTTATSTPKASNDDFDDAFADLPPASNVTATSSGAAKAVAPSADADFDTFEDDFDFKPSFEDPSATAATHGSTAAFDESFANFDASFDPTPSAKSSVGPGATIESAPSTGFSFDDAFGSDAPTNLADSLGVPVAAATSAAPEPSPALNDDVEGIKQIVAMGFSRTQAVEALEKYNYDPQRATNFLLG